MADRCPNCDKPILPADTVCWHCGYQLPKRAAAPHKQRVSGGAPDPVEQEQMAAPADYNWRALLIYGLLTLATALRVLGQAVSAMTVMVVGGCLQVLAVWLFAALLAGTCLWGQYLGVKA